MNSVHRALCEEEEPQNQSRRLPDDVVVHILNKVTDAKCLGRCCVVSKKFASLIPRVQTVSVARTWIFDFDSLSGNETRNLGEKFFHRKLAKFFIDGLLIKSFRYLLPLPPWSMNSGLFKFLDKLKQIQSLHVELPSYFASSDESIFKWGAKFTTKLESITYLFAKSLSKMPESGGVEGEEVTENELWEELQCQIVSGLECGKDAAIWIGILSLVVADYPTVQSFTITDSKKKGVKLCFDGGKLEDCRNSVDFRTMMSEMRPKWKVEEDIRAGYVPVVQLPISGYVMKGVTIVMWKMLANDNSDDDSAMLDAFAEEGGIFLEAVGQILANHKNNIV